MDGVVITAVLAGTGGIITLFIKYISSRDTLQEKRDDIFAAALAANTEAMKAVASSSEKVADETAKNGREAKQRNGHLGEQNIQITRMIANQNSDVAAIRVSGEANASANIKALALLQKAAVGTKEVAKALKDTPTNQVVDQQTVVHQTIKNKE